MVASRLNQLTLSVCHVPICIPGRVIETHFYVQADERSHIIYMRCNLCKQHRRSHLLNLQFVHFIVRRKFISCNRTFLHRSRSASVRLNKIIKCTISFFSTAKVVRQTCEFHSSRWNIPTRIDLSGCALIDSRQRQFLSRLSKQANKTWADSLRQSLHASVWAEPWVLM